MNTNEVLQLIQTLKETGFKHIDVSHEGSHILLSNAEYAGATLQNPGQIAPHMMAHTVPFQQSHQGQHGDFQSAISEASKQMENSTVADDSREKSDKTETKVLGGHLVESPIVGTFYDAPSPDADTYVVIGSKVKKGDVLCIIEAMKLMNEIEADKDGEIAEIFVNNEQGVEYGQALFRIV